MRTEDSHTLTKRCLRAMRARLLLGMQGPSVRIKIWLWTRWWTTGDGALMGRLVKSAHTVVDIMPQWLHKQRQIWPSRDTHWHLKMDMHNDNGQWAGIKANWWGAVARIASFIARMAEILPVMGPSILANMSINRYHSVYWINDVDDEFLPFHLQ